MTADEVKERLRLEPLPGEGGFFRETYRGRVRIPQESLPDHGGERSVATAIYYLVTPESFSAMHRIRSDEVFHFYMGDPVVMLQLDPSGGGQLLTLGADLDSHQHPQVVVPAGTWQGTRLRKGGAWALLGTTVSPGFDFEDYEHGDREALIADYPDWKDLLGELAR